MLLIGIDIGTSSIKVAVVDEDSGRCLASVHYPESEAVIISVQSGWAEQDPKLWWEHTKAAIQKLHHTKLYDPACITAIGIAYQMHGLVLLDKNQKVLRNAIIWCDSRATNKEKYPMGNFTAGKLAWVREHEPEIYECIDKFMLPGDYIAMKLTGAITITTSALSEGLFWNFEKEAITYYDFDPELFPKVQDVFSVHGTITNDIANELCLPKNIPVSYKAGDQLNNALSLNVFQNGEVAATAGTSGVIYAVTDKLIVDQFSRVNVFAHVNHKEDAKRLGVLLCINGTGIMNSWIKKVCGDVRYGDMNIRAAQVDPGSDGLMVFPFGNGAERMLENKIKGAHILSIDLNKHRSIHIFRAVQEGIAFAFRYGLDIMRENNIQPTVIRAGKTNMFLSDIFTESFVNATGVPVELYNTDGSIGAAIGAGVYKNGSEAFTQLKAIEKIEPTKVEVYNELYQRWKEKLLSIIN